MLSSASICASVTSVVRSSGPRAVSAALIVWMSDWLRPVSAANAFCSSSWSSLNWSSVVLPNSSVTVSGGGMMSDMAGALRIRSAAALLLGWRELRELGLHVLPLLHRGHRLVAVAAIVLRHLLGLDLRCIGVARRLRVGLVLHLRIVTVVAGIGVIVAIFRIGGRRIAPAPIGQRRAGA